MKDAMDSADRIPLAFLLGWRRLSDNWPWRRYVGCFSALRLLSGAGYSVLGQPAQALAEAVGWATKLDDVAMVGEAVYQGSAE